MDQLSGNASTAGSGKHEIARKALARYPGYISASAFLVFLFSLPSYVETEAAIGLGPIFRLFALTFLVIIAALTILHLSVASRLLTCFPCRLLALAGMILVPLLVGLELFLWATGTRFPFLGEGIAVTAFAISLGIQLGIPAQKTESESHE